MFHDFPQKLQQSRQNFQENCRRSCKDYLSQSLWFFSAQDSVHFFITRLQKGILIRLTLETFVNLLVKRDKEKKFYFSLCGFLEKVEIPKILGGKLLSFAIFDSSK